MSAKLKKKNSNTLIIVLALVIVALVAAVAIKNSMKPKGTRVAVEVVEARTIKETVAASGKIFPQTEVSISSDVSGEIVELYVEEGDSVASGQLLARIDPDAYQSQVERGVANVNSAKAQLANSQSQVQNLIAQREQILAQLSAAEETHKRNTKLKAQGVISDADFETSESNLKALQANLRASEASIRSAEEGAKSASFSVKSAEATLKELQTSLRRTTIYAPMNGIISRLSVEKGERVVGTIQMTGTEMMRIANLNAMEVRVEVSESDIPRVSLGDQVEIEVDAYLGKTFQGKVAMIANSAINAGSAGAMASLTSDQVTNFEVRINIDPSSYNDLIQAGNPYPLRPGMSASVEINTETIEGVISIPIQAVATRQRESDKGAAKADSQMVRSEDNAEVDVDDLMEVVFITNGTDVVEMVEVETGIQDDEFIQVLSGLTAGDEIVIGPYSAVARKLKVGDQVNKVSKENLYKTED